MFKGSLPKEKFCHCSLAWFMHFRKRTIFENFAACAVSLTVSLVKAELPPELSAFLKLFCMFPLVLLGESWVEPVLVWHP